MTTRPNLLFIMTDQQRFDALGANGNRIIQTPRLDELAASGINLQGYFSNSPVCVPSRCNLFTGRYPHSHRTRENYSLLEAGREIHLFRVLKQAGYRIGYCGKNHLVDPLEIPNFDFFSGAGSNEPSAEEKALMKAYYDWRNEIGVPPGHAEIWRAGYVHNLGPEATRTWHTAEAGLSYLNQQDGETPFALCISFEDPHVPHIAMQEYFDKYPPEDIDLYPSRDGELEEKAKRWAIKYGAFNARKATEQDKKRYIAVYYAMISWIDTQVGRILDSLEAKGLRENTIVVFLSDHGDFAFEHGLAKKDLVLVDSLLRVPCLISWPGTLPPRVVADTTIVEQVDIMPTLLDLMGIDPPFGVQGTSCASLLRGERSDHKDAAFAEVCPPYLFCKYDTYEEFAAENGGIDRTSFNVPGDFTKSIREKRFRYIWYSSGEEELYDHESDPFEQHNLARDPDYALEKTRLKMRLLEWHALTEDPLDANGLRDLQDQYGQWSPLSIQPGKNEKPGWIETRHLSPPRLP